ncbi:hypothetical protein QBC34DRAFT_462796 [Podospora aff. communis PSN243]|uniref:Uncharacterized protein n=1 Tax=Podospora aff. communis PSN243 TaxID=3040156 RepID=A0AAV9GMY1_9PEZI|nr:hypothetical protein QBC34DRAFT_462796 [Podospora aff. communis PSN243]
MSRHQNYSIVGYHGADLSPSPYRDEHEMYRDTRGFRRPLSRGGPKEASPKHGQSLDPPPPSFWVEAVCFVLSVGSFASIIAVLSVWQDQPLSKWPLPVSINAIVSILSAIFKASLVLPVSEGISQLKWIWFASGRRPLSDLDVFDRASRGPWGSFRLLTRGLFRSQQSGAPRVLASLGAFVVLVAIATDPFSQALIHFYSCPQASPMTLERAGIPRVNAFDQPNHQDAPDRPLQIAAFKGLMDPPANSSSTLAITCPTGNCRFPSIPDDGASFSTLALCPYCTDISHRAEKLTNGSYLLNEGSRLLLVDTSTPLATFSSDSYRNFGADPMSINLTTLFMLPTPSCNGVLDAPGCETKPLAVACEFRFCVQTYAAALTSGIYTETLLPSHTTDLTVFPISRQANLVYRAALLITNTTLVNGERVPCTPLPLNPTSEVNPNTDTHPDLNLPPALATSTNSTTPFPPECTYSVSGTALAAVAMLLYHRFGRILPSSSGRLVLDDAMADSSSGEFWLHTLWDGGHATADSVTAFASGWARSMSAEMRLYGNDTTGDGGFAWGEVVRAETCVGVGWGWGGFAGGLLVLEVVFGVLLVVLFVGKERGGWKSSAVALAVVGVDEGVIRGVRGVDGKGRRGEEVLVRLERDGEGRWKFRG